MTHNLFYLSIGAVLGWFPRSWLRWGSHKRLGKQQLRAQRGRAAKVVQ